MQAIRSRNVTKLRDLLKQGKSFDACNRNGETLLHLACRRADLETVSFLIHEAGVSASVRDDLGRTVLHDVCWRPEPSFELMDALFRIIPSSLLLAEDKRGDTPFDYVRPESREAWTRFLEERRDLIETAD